ncbi:hypothetical protein ACFR98_04740 [Gelatiniphilus marinus]
MVSSLKIGNNAEGFKDEFIKIYEKKAAINDSLFCKFSRLAISDTIRVLTAK